MNANKVCRALLVFAWAIHCGSQPSQFRLEISSSLTNDVAAPRITMQAGETRLVELLVVGAVPGPVTFSTEGLPAFGRLDGPILTLSPARIDQGEYAITLMAKSGNQTASSSLDLVVNRFNSPPQGPRTAILGDDRIDTRYFPACPGPGTCVAYGTPKLWTGACDPEGDGMTIDVEVVLRGHPFTGHPSYSTTTTESFNCGSPILWTTAISLPGLEREQSYDFALRATDQFGATNGWVRYPIYGFDQGPCVTRQCACYPSSPYLVCREDYECCSGVCIVDPLSHNGQCQ